MTQTFESQEVAFEKAIENLGMRPKKFIVDRLIGMWNKNRLLSETYDDTFSVLEDLRKDFKVAIVSNTDCFVDAVIDKFDMADKVDNIILSFQVGKLKQHDLFAHALEELGVSADEAVMVGDSIQTDIMGAERAGIKAVLIDRKEKREYHTKIKKLSELSEVLNSF
jgi:putative hydrolase of the HAD superfamily